MLYNLFLLIIWITNLSKHLHLYTKNTLIILHIYRLNTKIFSHQTSTAFDHAMDNCPDQDIKSAYRLDGQSINPVILEYFANTSAFIGYQNCAILAQKKLMGIACTIKAEEAVKNWFKISFTNKNVGDDEADDKVLAYIRKSDIRFKVKDHVTIAENLKLIDYEQANKISGSRFSVLKSELALLYRGLINFMLDIHTRENGYTEVVVPELVKTKTLYGTGQLPKFEKLLW